MLKQLRIQNFKGWQDTGSIRMAPLSLFFGANSSGKSSIGQFLMMLKQTTESADRRAVFYPGGKNSAVQLGSYQEMVFQRNLKNKVTFGYQWSIPDGLKFQDPLSKNSFSGSGDTLSFEAQVRAGDQEQYNLLVEYFEYRLLENKRKKLSLGMKKGPKTEYKINATGYKPVYRPGRPWLPGETLRFYGFPAEAVARYQNADIMQELNSQHESLFRSLCYLGPFRTKTDRLYSWGGIEPESVGFSGENTIAAILAAGSRGINLGFRQANVPFKEFIALKLKEMGLIEAFEVKRISTQRREYEVKVRTRGSRHLVDLPDVGFGISQVLPVLVQCFYAPPGSIILMEQPEIHLHPMAQAALADVMIDAINSREGGNPRNIQLIIETHSEHFLRRLQRRIAEGRVPQENVAVYFANSAKTPASLEPLQINQYGNIQNWPENFFGDEIGDIAAQAEAAMKRRMKQK